jgi:ribosomal protein S11
MAKKTVAAKKRNVKVDAFGQAHIHSSFNNIIVSLANSDGQVISWSLPVKWVSEALRKTLLMLPRWLHRIVLR